jgi:Tol biopolymer transport system component
LTVDPSADLSPLVLPDGRSVLFRSERAGGGIWRIDLDGGNQRALVNEPDAWPGGVSPDAKWLYYTLTNSTPRQVWRLPLQGGAAERLTADWPEMRSRWESAGVRVDGMFYAPTMVIFGVSPDGAALGGQYADPDRRGFRAGMFPIAAGAPTRTDILIPLVEWSRDGRSLIYLDPQGGRTNVYRWPLGGGKPTPVTSFTTDDVMGFGLSRDGTQLALSRGTFTSDVVLIARANEGR